MMELRQALSGFWTGTLSWDFSMADYCTLKAGGKAAALVVATSRPELAGLIVGLEENSIRWRVIGRGSNILVPAGGYDGVLIILGGDFCAIAGDPGLSGDDGRQTVRVGAGCPAAKLVGWSVVHQLSGLEFMAGIPGSIGGAVFMNAGAWGGEIADVVEGVSFVDRRGRFHDVGREDIDFSYRRMRPRDPALEGAAIVGATFSLRPDSQRLIIEQCRSHVAGRRRKQPLSVASAGSFFRNPPGDSAGRLIEAAGLKGLQKGEAMVSPKHANFIVNTGRASADDIVELMREVQERVYRFSGIRLEPEVHLLEKG
ncbi:MAG: UDP-N-acetylmuramate dehydrogenase [Desulfobulbaceae bacterium]|jgi:UDP-N-acetylmuramate dehydrogenase|nr:UDP-N-acetylmuramate dehydrogenase [Desulfobulbaceae bacterium]MDY0349663.1 UDP-N-acetylmuramate dehydrogenase [Desulfobulbaceae bacterium]